VLQPATDFGATAAASELAWLEEIAHSSSPADIEGATVAASTRLALINGLSAATPASPFASYALHIPTSHVLYQGDLEQTATLADGAPGLLVLRLSDDQIVEAILLEPGDANASLQVRARGDLRAQNGALPGIGRPDARLVSRGDGYGIAVALEFVNRARVEFAVTCTVPLLGARATTISDGASTAGTLDLAMTTVLALTQVTALEDEPQIVCVDTFGTVETGRIALDEVTAAAVGA
jgi:hypothetical protein